MVLGLADLSVCSVLFCFYGWYNIPCGGCGFVGLAVGFVGCALDAFLWFGWVALRGFGF